MNGTPTLALLIASSLLSRLCDPDPKPVAETECWRHDVAGERLTSCDNDVEPDDDLFTARRVAAPTCAAQELEGTLSGDDVDVARAQRAPLCESGVPTLTLDTPGVRACLFVQCSTGSTGLGGCSAGLAMHLPNGLVGCCLSEPGSVSGTFACSSRKREADGFIIVDSTSDECRGYRVDYHF